MLSVEEARERILANVRLTEAEEIPLLEAAGRVPAVASVTAAVDVPPFANSSMDGFALRAADAPGELPLTGEVAAGAATLPTVAPGSVVRIMTGAPIPPGADTVIPLDVSIGFDDLPSLARIARAAIGGDRLDYRLDGTFAVEAGGYGRPRFGPWTLLEGEIRVR